MAIDMATLKSTTFGDPESKLTVKRSWLKEVYRLLAEGEQAKRELAELKARVQAANDLAERSNDPRAWKDLDEGMDKIFGDNGAFGKFFGKGRGRGI
jgi:hypothetical protein